MNPVYNGTEGSRYRWYILALIALTGSLAFAMPQMCMPVLFKEISVDLGLNLVQIGTVWAIVPFAGMFVFLPGGLLSDRFGTKKILVAGCFLAGTAGILRGFSDSFFTLSATMFLFGMLLVSMAPAMIRACGVWFPGRHLGLANGVLSMSMGFGFLVSSMISATVLSPLLGGWKNVLIMYGVVSIGMSVLWFFTRTEPGRDVSSAEKAESASFRASLSHVIRIKQIWILGLIMIGQIGCVQGTLGYLPLYLRDVGWAEAAADGTLAAFHGISTIFTVPIVLLSNRLGSRRIILLTATLMTAIGVGLLSVVSGPGVWISVIIAGIVRDGFMALLMTTLLETEGVGTEYAGTAIGLIHTVSRVGEMLSPPLGNSLANFNLRYPFILWAGMAAAVLSGFPFIKDTRQRLSQ
jgi:cyanate permease